VDLQGCSRERGLVVVVAWLSRAALLPQDRVPDARIVFGAHPEPGLLRNPRKASAVGTCDC
jgi:hypothetical protein